MRFSAFFAALAAATGAAAHAANSPRTISEKWCGTKEPTEAQLAASRRLSSREVDNVHVKRSPYYVDVWFHAIALSETEEDGYLSNATFQAQFDVLKADFEPLGIIFTLKGITRRIAPEWAYDQNELAYKKALRQGDYKTLNAYFLPGLIDVGLLGYAYFPDNIAAGSDEFYLDGIVIASQSVPGGSLPRFNLGKTITHEVGHWFNLYHTFQGGCSGDGDFIRDTPAQAGPTSGCPIGRDSCPNASGLDPIHNYMDYSDDACYSEFTGGQRRRAHSSWREYRK